MNFFRLFILLLFIASFNSKADTFFERDSLLTHSKAELAMSEGNFAVSFCLWEPLAQKGDSKAQFNIGWMFHNGYGLAIDDSKALGWWLKAAEQGYTEAFYTLADLYLAGFGVEKDKDIAMGWYIAAAKRGHEASLEVIHSLAARKDELSQKYFKKLLQQDMSLLGDKMRVKVKRANVREGPSKDYKVKLTLSEGELVIPMKRSGNWVQIGVVKSGKIAWIYNTLIEEYPYLVEQQKPLETNAEKAMF